MKILKNFKQFNESVMKMDPLYPNEWTNISRDEEGNRIADCMLCGCEGCIVDGHECDDNVCVDCGCENCECDTQGNCSCEKCGCENCECPPTMNLGRTIDMGESKKWIKDATKNKGALRSKLGKKKGEKISDDEIDSELSNLKQRDKDQEKPGLQLSPRDRKKHKELVLAKTLKSLKK